MRQIVKPRQYVFICPINIERNYWEADNTRLKLSNITNDIQTIFFLRFITAIMLKKGRNAYFSVLIAV